MSPESQPVAEFSRYEIECAATFIQMHEVMLAGDLGQLKAEYEDFCDIELGLPTREQAGALWEAAKDDIKEQASEALARKNNVTTVGGIIWQE